MTVLRICFSLTTLAALRGTSNVFCRPSLNWYLIHVFLVIEVGLWVLGVKTTKMNPHSHCILSVVHVINRLIAMDVAHHHLDEVVFVKVLSSPYSCIIFLGRRCL